MIRAAHTQWAKAVFYPFIRHIMRSDYSAFRLSGEVPELPSGRAVLVTPNHIGWWDGFFIHSLNRLLWRRRFYLMMLEGQLRTYWYFRHLGAYSIEPGSPRAARESLQYSLELLGEPGNMVVLYPEGELRSQFFAPGKLQRGVEWLCRETSRRDSARAFSILPVSFLIQSWDRRKPELLCRCASPIASECIAVEPGQLQRSMEENWRAACDTLSRRDFSRTFFGPKGST